MTRYSVVRIPATCVGFPEYRVIIKVAVSIINEIIFGGVLVSTGDKMGRVASRVVASSLKR